MWWVHQQSNVGGSRETTRRKELTCPTDICNLCIYNLNLFTKKNRSHVFKYDLTALVRTLCSNLSQTVLSLVLSLDIFSNQLGTAVSEMLLKFDLWETV